MAKTIHILTDKKGKELLKGATLTDITPFSIDGSRSWALHFADGETACCRNEMDIYKAIEIKRQGKEIPAWFPADHDIGAETEDEHI